MAEIVRGVGTSHGPLLILPPDSWPIRRDADMQRPVHDFRGDTYSFDELVEHRRGTLDFDALTAPAKRQEHFDRCQTQLDALGEYIRDANPDVLVVIGDDQHEWFHDQIQPPFTVFCGDAILNSAYDAEKEKDRHLSIQMVEAERHTPVDTYYECVPELATHMITSAVDEGFDITSSSKIPENGDGPIGIGHAFSFIYRRILRDKPIPLVPILVNTFYPPNQALPKRCFDLGAAIGRAIRSWPSDKRVMILASGGLSHYVIDEDWDRRYLKAMQDWDIDTIKNEPNSIFRSGTSETKNWVVALGALHETGFKMNLLDYVPCYRSEAGNGNAMAFATWQ